VPFLIGILLVFSLADAAFAQSRLAQPERAVRISELTIESNTLPAADRERIIRSFANKTYPEGEIGERVRDALRDEGYFRATVDEPQFSFPATQTETAKVIVKVNPGSRYRLGEISFQHTTAFPPQQLRKLFAQQTGDLFNTTEFGAGLTELRKLYGTHGYINMVGSPQVRFDESRGVVDWVVAVDEGQIDMGRPRLR